MRILKISNVCGALLLAAGFAAYGATPSNPEYGNDTELAAKLQASLKACARAKPHARKLCIKEAKRRDMAARAELEESYEPESSQNQQMRVAQANNDYAEAQEWASQHAGATRNAQMADPVRDDQYTAMLAQCKDGDREDKARCVARAKRWYNKN